MTTQQLRTSPPLIGDGYQIGEVPTNQRFKFDYLMCPSYKRYVAPIIRRNRANLLIFTISPDIKSLEDTKKLRDEYLQLFFTSQVPFFSVSEVAHKSGRLHWHGVLECKDDYAGSYSFRNHFVTQFKAIKGAFVDVQKPRNMSNWVSYCMKEVKTGCEISQSLLFPKIGPTFLPDVKLSNEINESDGSDDGSDHVNDLSWLIAPDPREKTDDRAQPIMGTNLSAEPVLTPAGDQDSHINVSRAPGSSFWDMFTDNF